MSQSSGKYRTVVLAMLLTYTVHSSTSAELLSTTVPFISPNGNYVTQPDRYHTFRIPAMIVAPDGSILAFAEGRRGDGSDPRRDKNAPIDVVMRQSTDNGETWQRLVVIDSGFRPNGKLVDFGDPTPVVDAITGTVFLFYGQWPDIGPIHVAHGQSADPDDGNQIVWVRSSADSGKTWSDRKQVLYPDEPDETNDGLFWRQAEPGPGSGIQLQWQGRNSRNGRLIIPAKRSGSATPDGPVTVEPFVYYSDDQGVTWRVGNVTPGPDANESEVVELSDGRVLLDARQNSGDLRRRHLSTDGGVKWGPDNPSKISLTQVDGSLLRYSAKRAAHDRDRILFSGPRGDGGLNRNNVTVWTSYDEGKTFVNPVQFGSGFAAYSVLQRLADGTIGLLVETASGSAATYGEITFYRFDVAELEREHPVSLSAIPSPIILRGDATTAYRDPAVIYHAGWFRLFFTLVKIEPDKRPFSYTAWSKSRNLVTWSEPVIFTPRDQALNYGSPGNIIRYGNEWVLCLQTYPRPNGEQYGNENARIWTMRSKDLETWGKPELLRVKGPDVPRKRMGRMIDAYLLEDKHEEGKWWCFYKQAGMSMSWSRDIRTWTYVGRTSAGENACAIVDGDDYVLFHSPGNGIGVKRSKNLGAWRDEGVLTLGQNVWPWAQGRLTAGFVLDLRKELAVGKALMFFHGSDFPEKDQRGGFDNFASIGLAWSDDLRNWTWPGQSDGPRP